MPSDALADALADAGGVLAPREHHARLRGLLQTELARGRAELEEARSGQADALVVAIAALPEPYPGFLAVVPVDPALRADPAAVPERGWLMVAALVGALAEVGADPLGLSVGTGGAGHLALRVPGHPTAADDAELAVVAFDEQAQRIDRLRVRGLAVPAGLLSDVEDLRPPIGGAHPLNVAAQVAALGGRPADPDSLAEHEETVLAALAQRARSTDPAHHGAPRPHEDPDPARRVARRILQRLDGMGKWGGYHTEFSHLARGFAGHDRALAEAVGEALLDAGLLREKPSVGQRHVFLDPGRAADIRAAIDDGELPSDLELPDA